jgi:hypothetical protein
MPLTDTAIRNAKPGKKAVKLSDGGGLFLLIQPSGTKLWRLAYRFAGKQRLLAFGAYPTISLADARAQRDAARKNLADGVDPAVRRKLEKQAKVVTFRIVADELLEKMRREGRAAATLTKTSWLLEFALSDIGDRPISKISAQELLNVLRKIEARGNYETARRLRSTCGMVFRYAIATGRADRDPSADLRGALTAPKVKHRATIVEPKAIGALMRAIDGFDGLASRWLDSWASGSTALTMTTTSSQARFNRRARQSMQPPNLQPRLIGNRASMNGRAGMQRKWRLHER